MCPMDGGWVCIVLDDSSASAELCLLFCGFISATMFIGEAYCRGGGGCRKEVQGGNVRYAKSSAQSSRETKPTLHGSTKSIPNNPPLRCVIVSIMKVTTDG